MGRPRTPLLSADRIADAALYLSKTKPELGIEDPYSLTPEQLDAAADLFPSRRVALGSQVQEAPWWAEPIRTRGRMRFTPPGSPKGSPAGDVFSFVAAR